MWSMCWKVPGWGLEPWKWSSTGHWTLFWLWSMCEYVPHRGCVSCQEVNFRLMSQLQWQEDFCKRESISSPPDPSHCYIDYFENLKENLFKHSSSYTISRENGDLMIYVPPKPDSYIPIFNRILSSVSFICAGESTTSPFCETGNRLLILIPGFSVDRTCNPERNVQIYHPVQRRTAHEPRKKQLPQSANSTS